MTDKRDNRMEVDEEDVVELINENGEVERFIFEMPVQYNGKTYALTSSEANEEEAAFFEIVEDGKGEIWRLIVDDALLEKLYEVYLNSIEDEE